MPLTPNVPLLPCADRPQLLKCVHNPPPGLSPEEAREFEDENSVLLRAYGNDTSILIDRERVYS